MEAQSGGAIVALTQEGRNTLSAPLKDFLLHKPEMLQVQNIVALSFFFVVLLKVSHHGQLRCAR